MPVTVTKERSVDYVVLKNDKGQPTGQIEALVSVFGNVDKQGERVVQGAFKDSLEKWRAKSKPIPIIWAHKWSDPMAYIGGWDPHSAQEVAPSANHPGGLLLKGQVHINQGNPVADQAFFLLKNGLVDEFSFASIVKKEWRNPEDLANELQIVDIVEAGPCLKGVNADTELMSVKSMLELSTDLDSTFYSYSLKSDFIKDKKKDSKDKKEEAEWDGQAAMSAAVKAKSPVSAFKAICAGRSKDGEDDAQTGWSGPHHATPAAPPNLKAVKMALGQVEKTHYVDPAAAKKHLEAHLEELGVSVAKPGEKKKPAFLDKKGADPEDLLRLLDASLFVDEVRLKHMFDSNTGAHYNHPHTLAGKPSAGPTSPKDPGFAKEIAAVLGKTTPSETPAPAKPASNEPAPDRAVGSYASRYSNPDAVQATVDLSNARVSVQNALGQAAIAKKPSAVDRADASVQDKYKDLADELDRWIKEDRLLILTDDGRNMWDATFGPLRDELEGKAQKSEVETRLLDSLSTFGAEQTTLDGSKTDGFSGVKRADLKTVGTPEDSSDSETPELSGKREPYANFDGETVRSPNDIGYGWGHYYQKFGGQPKGKAEGLWKFNSNDEGEEATFEHDGTYTEAKAAARQWAFDKGLKDTLWLSPDSEPRAGNTTPVPEYNPPDLDEGPARGDAPGSLAGLTDAEMNQRIDDMIINDESISAESPEFQYLWGRLRAGTAGSLAAGITQLAETQVTGAGPYNSDDEDRWFGPGGYESDSGVGFEQNEATPDPELVQNAVEDIADNALAGEKGPTAYDLAEQWSEYPGQRVAALEAAKQLLEADPENKYYQDVVGELNRNQPQTDLDRSLIGLRNTARPMSDDRRNLIRIEDKYQSSERSPSDVAQLDTDLAELEASGSLSEELRAAIVEFRSGHISSGSSARPNSGTPTGMRSANGSNLSVGDKVVDADGNFGKVVDYDEDSTGLGGRGQVTVELDDGTEVSYDSDAFMRPADYTREQELISRYDIAPGRTVGGKPMPSVTEQFLKDAADRELKEELERSEASTSVDLPGIETEAPDLPEAGELAGYSPPSGYEEALLSRVQAFSGFAVPGITTAELKRDNPDLDPAEIERAIRYFKKHGYIRRVPEGGGISSARKWVIDEKTAPERYKSLDPAGYFDRVASEFGFKTKLSV